MSFPGDRITGPNENLATPNPVSASSLHVEPISILLVDDEVKNLAVLESVLDDPQYRLVRAQSADEALLALIVEEFALIILDIQMPVMSGFELAQMIKQRKKTAGIPIIFLTAYYSEEQDVLVGYETGAVDYLHKPVNTAILRSKVSIFADLHRKTRENVYANQSLLKEVSERRRAEEQLTRLNEELEARVEARTNELVLANAALRLSEESLRLAQQAGKVGVWEWDLKSGLGLWNEAALAVFGSDAPAKSLSVSSWLACVHPEDREHAARAFELAKSSGRYGDEYRLAAAGSQSVWIESIGAVEFEDGAAIRMRGVIRDITERKLLELQLIEGNRRKDEFLAMLGHELRNPLAPIRNAVSIFQQAPNNEESVRWCGEIIDRQVSHLTRLVNDLLDVSRVSQGKIQLQKEIIALDQAVTHAVETCRPLLAERNHDLQVDLPPQTLHVRGDQSRLSQVVANLLSNAAKYTNERGSIRVSVALDPQTGAQAVIRVSDNGRGFDSEASNKLFDLFYQVERDLDRSEGGLGIGLALVRSLVHLHGGAVEAHSAGPGQGSEFTVRIPCELVVSPAPESPSQATETAPRRKVLVVDDNYDSASTMGALLKLLGHEIVLAFDGHSALESAVREKPDVILMDIGLPGMSGYEVCRELRAGEHAFESIIAVTGYGRDEDRRQSREAGFDKHLVKPVSLNDIQGVMQELAGAR